MKSHRLIVALDTPNFPYALDVARAVSPYCGVLKVGTEFFSAHGRDGVEEISGILPVMLDLKLHDIPVTVERTVNLLTKNRRIKMLTIHAAGGSRMIKAATGSSRATWILSVIALSSLAPTSEEVHNLAELAFKSGAHGVVCPPPYGKYLRSLYPRVKIVCPGIRMNAARSRDDHAATGTPEEVQAFADYLVVGRPILTATDPAMAASVFAEAIEHEKPT